MFVEAENCSTAMVAKRSEAANPLYKPNPDDGGKSALSHDDNTASNKRENSTLHSTDDPTPDVSVLKLFHILATLLRCIRFAIDEWWSEQAANIGWDLLLLFINNYIFTLTQNVIK